jgi:hypothetical protein
MLKNDIFIITVVDWWSEMLLIIISAFNDYTDIFMYVRNYYYYLLFKFQNTLIQMTKCQCFISY